MDRPTLALNYADSFVSELPGDPVEKNIPRQVHGAVYSEVAPRTAGAPELVAVSPEAAGLLDLDLDAVTEDDLARVLSGNALDDGMRAYAANYGGHQFGNWAGQLGDGRAHAPRHAPTALYSLRRRTPTSASSTSSSRTCASTSRCSRSTSSGCSR